MLTVILLGALHGIGTSLLGWYFNTWQYWVSIPFLFIAVHYLA